VEETICFFHREDNVDGRVSVTKDEWASAARRLNGDEVMQIKMLVGCQNYVRKWKELVFNALGYIIFSQ